jgi:glycosyltransferase involved in cell wall biosynthesis
MKIDPSALISLVIPCFNEEEVIHETLTRLNALAASLEGYAVEFVFVDDGSRDKTRELLTQAAMKDPRIKVIAFARNFGHQVAVTAGVDMASGDAVVLIDADLQDPPEVVLTMVEKWREGYDVAYGVRAERLGESRFKLFTAKWFYRLLNRISDISIPLDTGDFRLMSRRVVECLKKMPEQDRFIRGMVSWVGFRQIGIPYTRVPRFAGESKYPLRKMIRFSLDGILSFSTKPLRIAMTLGMTSSLIALGGIAYVLYVRLFTHSWVEGWAGILCSILFLGGVQLIAIGILGEYIGRIYNESKRRPLYFVDEVISASDQVFHGGERSRGNDQG